MRIPRALPAGATERLAGLLKEAKTKSEYQRIQCLWLRAALGLSAAEIAHALGWQASSGGQLHSKYLRHGEAVLESKPHTCRPHQNLTLAQEQELPTCFFEQAQAGQLPTVASIRTAYEQKLGRTVHPSVVYRLLDRQGWRKIVPRPKHPKADEAVREELKKLPELVQEHAAAQALVSPSLPVRLLFEDEARCGPISDPHRCWAPPGIRPEVDTQIVREYEYAFAAVCPHDGVLDTLVLPSVSAEAMSVFLAEVSRRHPQEFLLMVLDGAGWHKAKRLKIPERMQLVPLPSWSPQLNPAEHVWDRDTREVVHQSKVCQHGRGGGAIGHGFSHSRNRHHTSSLAGRL